MRHTFGLDAKRKAKKGLCLRMRGRIRACPASADLPFSLGFSEKTQRRRTSFFLNPRNKKLAPHPQPSRSPSHSPLSSHSRPWSPRLWPERTRGRPRRDGRRRRARAKKRPQQWQRQLRPHRPRTSPPSACEAKQPETPSATFLMLLTRTTPPPTTKATTR